MVTDLGVRGTGKPAKDVDRARATPMGRGLCTRALCREKGTAPLLGAQGHQAHQAHACIRTNAYQKCTQQRKPGSSCASDANIDAGASTPAQGIQAGCVGIPHIHTHTTTCVPPMHVTRTSHCHCCWWHWAGQPMGGGGHRGRPHRHHGAVTWRWRRWQLRCFPG